MKTFNIIRHYNSPNRAEYRGITVYRQEKIFIPERGQFVMCAPYDDHFIFEVRDPRIVGSAFQCTCGSAAVFTGFGAYSHDASPSNTGGLMLVCLVHSSMGQHATGGSRWI